MCKECGQVFAAGKRLSDHIKKVHGMQVVDYCIKHMYGGVAPSCPECGKLPRFVSLIDGFKAYCKDHARLAMKLAGAVGGKMNGKLKTWQQQAQAIMKLADGWDADGVAPKPTQEAVDAAVKLAGIAESFGFSDIEIDADALGGAVVSVFSNDLLVTYTRFNDGKSACILSENNGNVGAIKAIAADEESILKAFKDFK